MSDACKWGHDEGRYADGHCKVCAKAARQRWEQRNKERVVEARRKRFQAAPEETREKQREWSRRWKQANPEKAKAAARNWRERNPYTYTDGIRQAKLRYNLRKKYGLTEDAYDAMLAQQGGACAICKTPPPEGTRLHVDHCHNTTVVRGMLCSKCNTGLGQFVDDVARLRAAISYLEQM